MDPVEPLQDFDNPMVFGRLDRLTDQESVLREFAPCYAGGLGWQDRRQGLVFAEERL